jgi:hypothetical protein
MAGIEILVRGLDLVADLVGREQRVRAVGPDQLGEREQRVVDI